MTSVRFNADTSACGVRVKFIHMDMATIEVAFSGPVEGAPVLALHGGMGGWDQSLILAQALFGEGSVRRLLAVSRPGYLGTALEAGRGPAAEADLYAALLDHLGIERAAVIAVSAGGPAALAFAHRYPERVAALVLVSCCTGTLVPPRAVSLMLPLMRLAARSALVNRMLKRRLGDPVEAARRSIRDPDVLARTLADPDASRLMALLNRSVSDRMAERLPGTIADTRCFAAQAEIAVKSLKAPTLVIHGTADRVVPFEHGSRVAEQAPSGELMAVEGGEHVALFTALDHVRSRVAVFLAANEKPASG
ncbi:alpha/beta fold hydrolase [Martelella radicis]|uniref:Pimeloyl-ACP methyl ester carboxylesterase n=1 Tax=Martelella radicis TaxID=1397476 RepID=A0A7W6KJE8_9HYPH|nr:alpha/beta hydrolase [Martelella radicis]MBB4122207.1 pimeloyl-ACP methyl ester carboxylesterase [Martelella radicis]